MRARVESVGADDRSLTLTWDARSEAGPPVAFPWLWLRDNCRCPTCHHPQAFERTLDLLQIPFEIRAKHASLDESGAVRIVWPDGHVSVFEAAWLHAHRVGQAPAPTRSPQLWGAELAEHIPRIPYEDVIHTDEGRHRWCEALRDWGVAFVTGVPPEEGQSARVGERIGFVWTHIPGKIFDIQPRDSTESLAYTALGLSLHTDLPSRATPPRYQLLHCIENGVDGGELIVANAFTIAAALRAEAPELYELLSELPVEFRFLGASVDYRFRTHILEHRGDRELWRVRFNTFLQGPLALPAASIEPFYRAYRAFLTLTTERRFQVRVRLAPSDLISFDNWRILHGRAPFDPLRGRRHMQTCYVEADELESRMRLLEQAGHGST